eukprot:Nitzschia sp. Nitz4//scaffold65_size103378//31684//32505//NITZ4_004461-RA/size103378-processed-gene-0.46-mRNA-1//-1//CDS//3329556225//2150//frame0
MVATRSRKNQPDNDEQQVHEQIATDNLFVLDNEGHAEEEGNHEEAALELKPVEKKKRGGQKRKTKEGNELTKLIPGYTAPMKLDTSSLDKYRPVGGLQELQRRAELQDMTTRHYASTTKHSDAMQKASSKGILSKNFSYEAAYSSFKKGTKKAPDTTAGKGWFGMTPTPLTEELKADLSVIRNRNYLDPKKFYKSSDKFGSVVQVGTVIEGASEYYSSRLTKKQRRNNFTEEIMADPASADYARNKFREMARDKTALAKKRAHKPKRSGKRGF